MFDLINLIGLFVRFGQQNAFSTFWNLQYLTSNIFDQRMLLLSSLYLVSKLSSYLLADESKFSGQHKRTNSSHG